MANDGNMDRPDWAVEIDTAGRTRRFGALDLPLTIGGEPGADVPIDGLPGTIQIGRLGSVFFVQTGRNTRNVRVDGALVAGSRELRDGEIIAFDRARLACRISGGRLRIGTELLTTAGDTAPPDLDELARGSADRAPEVAITPIAFKPGRSTASGPRVRRPSNATIAVSAAFLVLAVLAWFAFTARSVALTFEPAADIVDLPSTFFKVRLGDRLLLRSGSHRVAATLAGYYPLDTEIEVGRSPDQSFTLAFTKLPGLVSLGTDPEVGAEVRLDGAEFGRTPLSDAEIPPGLHRLEFSADRHLPQVLELEVRGGGERQSLVATLTPNWAPVSLATDPPGAEVLVDGTSIGVTPLEMPLTAGERDLEVRLSGYNAWRSRIVVIADQPQQLPPVKLAQADGRVELASSPSEANVSIDGEFRGRTPLTLRLTPGRAHRLTLAKPGYATVTRELSVAADSGRRLEIELEAQYGEIEVRSTPVGVEIWVDGRREGATPSTLTLTAVGHDIELRQQGYATAAASITPRPGFPQVLELALESLDRSSGSGYAQMIRTSIGQELKLIPAGQFTMGSSRREQGRRSNEVLRPVRLTRAFYLGVREVSNAEFRAFRSDHDSGEFGGQTLNGDEQPVVRVTWDEAAQFMNWLSIKDGLQPVYEERQGSWVAVRPLRNGYRLPTEAEWEWAARFAGRDTGLTYPWGAELPPPDRSGNYADVAAAQILPTTLVTYNDGFAVSAPSGSFAASELGIHDLGGNVTEWMQDYYVIDAVESTELADDPLGPETGRFHVLRGASWRSATVTDLRLAARNYSGDTREDVGFRLARNLE
jgi:formylglycine-generating enzyme required for sulfatase activity